MTTTTATTDTTATFHERDHLYLGGRWEDADGRGGVSEVVEAATEQVMGRVPQAGSSDVDRAVAAARAAFPAWSQTPVGERAELLSAMGAGLAARTDEIATLVSREVGTPKNLSVLIHAGLPMLTLAHAAELVASYPFEAEAFPSLVVREPVGVVAAIIPWNYPVHQAVAKVAWALAAGSTVVLKPSEVAPLSAFVLAEIAEGAGLPAGVLNVVTGPGRVVGDALVAHTAVDMVSFTGSTNVGRRVGAVAARSVKRVALELGGKSANVILDDAPLDQAVPDGVAKCFLNAGQTCSALTRMLVPRAALAEVEALAAEAAATYVPGDPFAPETTLGPLASLAQRDRVRAAIRRAVDEGATLVTGGPSAPEGLSRGYFVRPTVFSGVTPEMAIARKEVFGPVLAILAYDSEDEAVDMANDSDYGLSGGVWSGDPERALAVARRLRTGQVEINGAMFNPRAPFGGYKQSGNGRELGAAGLEEFLETKAIQR
ncbi:MAG: aldehyde dehydrogenase family protein [Actinomycetota bacterium]|nr:aldehyde dehydrogenase family protein [Actinomycetota bacterium]